MTPEREIIIVHETVAQSVMRDATTLVIFVALIGLGWWIESNAMQWFGGALAFLWTMGRAALYRSKNTHDIASARKRIDELEAEFQ